VIDKILNILSRCAHRHLTRPFTPLGTEGVAHGETYVVCLDCTKQFVYDLKEMRIGRIVDHAHDACVIPLDMAKDRKANLAYVLRVAVPVAVLVGAALTTKKPAAKKKQEGQVEPDSAQNTD